MRRSRIAPFAPAALRVAALVVLLAPVPASAVVRNWNNPAGGSAGTSTNWTPNGVPGAADNLIFPLSGTYAVSFPGATVPAATSLNAYGGVLNLSSDGTHTLSSSFAVGTTGTGGVNVTGGTFVARSLYAGLVSGLYGRLTLTTPGGIPAPPPPVFQTTDATQPCLCGGDGTGRLEVLGGARLQAAGSLQLGAYTTGRCTLTVAGRNNFYIQNSQLLVAGPALIGTYGTAIAKVDNGGFVRISGATNVGNTPTGNGSLLVGTSTTVFTPSFVAEQDLRIGDSGFPGGGGGASFVQLTKGYLGVGNRTYLGDPDGNSNAAQLLIEGGAFVASRGFTRQSGTTFTHTGGILHVAGGTIEYPASISWFVDGTAARPELWVGTGTPSNLSGNLLSVGLTGQGLLRVVRPGTRFATTGQVYVGHGVPSQGEAVVDSGAVLAGDQVIVGYFGIGDLSVRGGGRAETRTASVGWQPGSRGTLRVTGAGSAFVAETGVTLGGITPGPLTGTAVVDSGGVLECTAPGWYVWVSEGTGRLVAGAGGTVRADFIEFAGLGELAGGLLDGPDVYVDPPGTLRGFGDVDGMLHSEGLLDPGLEGGGFGTIRIQSTTTLQAGGRLAISLGRTAAAPDNDTLRVMTAGLVLGGTLELTADTSFVGNWGDTFVVATAPVVVGDFGAVTWNGSPVAGEFDVVVQPTRVLVISRLGTLDAGPAGGPPAELRFRALAGEAAAFSLELPAAADVRVALYDVSGRQVADLHEGALPAGTHRLRAAVASLASGVYFARAEVTRGGRTEVRTLKTVRLR